MWPLMTTVALNGYDGVQITPRWATNIYYNVNLRAELLFSHKTDIVSVNFPIAQWRNGSTLTSASRQPTRGMIC